MYVIEHPLAGWYAGPMSGFTENVDRAARFVKYTDAELHIPDADALLRPEFRGALEVKSKWFGPPD